MAEESRQGKSGDGRRRRYFRRKSGDKPAGEQPASGESRPAQPRPEGRKEQRSEPRASARSEPRTEGRAENRPEGRTEGRTEGRAPGRTSGRAPSRPEGHGSSVHGLPRHESRDEHPSMLDKRDRGVRRRRKGKSRRPEGRSETPPVQAVREPDYVPPNNIFIYTHTVRPAGSGAYEFRSEHFSKVGHTLDDYTVDISSVFKTTTREERAEAYARYFADFDYGEEAEGELPAGQAPEALPPAQENDLPSSDGAGESQA